MALFQAQVLKLGLKGQEQPSFSLHSSLPIHPAVTHRLSFNSQRVCIQRYPGSRWSARGPGARPILLIQSWGKDTSKAEYTSVLMHRKSIISLRCNDVSVATALSSVNLSLESHLAKSVPHVPVSYFILHLATSPEQDLFEKFHKATMTIIMTTPLHQPFASEVSFPRI